MKVKICGVTHPQDAEYASKLGADYIGIIFCERSRRHVSAEVAKSIVNIVKQFGVEPVGVFSDHNDEQIHAICQQTGIQTIQLHGTKAKQALYALIDDYHVIYSIPVEKDGSVSELQRLPKVTYLYDNSVPGSGKPFDWMNFTPPQSLPWILAGGLNPNNVEEAINLLNPAVVDVATGVEYPGSIRKNPMLLKDFLQAAKKEII